MSTLKIPSTLKSARSLFYSSALLIRCRGLWGAAAHPLVSHHLTVFEVTADSYWAVMALPLSLAQVPAFSRPLKYSHTLYTLPQHRRRKEVCLGLVPLWVSVASRYTWPISLTNENAWPLTSCFCPVSQAPRERRELARRVPGMTGSKSSVNHEVEDNEKPWSQNKGKGNVSSNCVVRSVNVSLSPYGNMAAFKKVRQKCFLLGQTGRVAQEWIYLSVTTKPRKTREEQQRRLILHQTVSLPKQHASVSFLFLHVTHIIKYHRAGSML